MSKKVNILIVDDQQESLELLRIMLSAQGFEVVTALEPHQGLRLAYQYHPDLVLLDVMMPQIDGLELCQRLRELSPNIPIIFVTAKGTIEDIVKGFSAGADDYIVKPFNRQELLARIQACLRHTANDAEPPSKRHLYPDERVMLDRERHELIVDHQTIYLTPREFEILQHFIRHIGKVLTPNALLSQVWGAERIGDTDLVKQYIHRLRQKIERDPENPRYLHTVRGEGYYFEPK